MLPDYPKEKSKINDFFFAYIELKKRSISPFISSIAKVRIFEGRNQIIIREDGSREESEYKKIEMDIPYEVREIQDIAVSADPLGQIMQRIAVMTQKLVVEENKLFFARINKAVEEVGNVINGSVKDFAESFFDLLKMVQIRFDEKGEPIMPTIILNPKTAEEIKLKEKINEMEKNPEIREKFAAIIDEKREEWRDRESARRLVG